MNEHFECLPLCSDVIFIFKVLSYADRHCGDVARAGIACTVCYVANVGKLVNTLETVHELVALSEG